MRRPLSREGGIRTHGTVTRTTVFEFYDSHIGLCRLVTKRVLLFAISQPIIPGCDAQCRSVPRSWFAIWFANLAEREVANDSLCQGFWAALIHS